MPKRGAKRIAVAAAKRGGRRVAARRVRRGKRTTSTAGPRISGLRTLSFVPVSTDLSSNKSWADFFWNLGIIAMKLFVANYSQLTEFGEQKSAPVSCCQSIFVSAGDLLLNSPITETATVDGYSKGIPFVDYSQARLSKASVTVSPAARLSERAGRIVVAVVPMNYSSNEFYSGASTTNAKYPELVKGEEASFDKITQFPGARVAPATSKVRVHLPTSGWSGSWLNLGTRLDDPKDFGKSDSIIGTPLFKIYFGYQDFSGPLAASDLYSASEAFFNVDLRGSIQLREPGRRYLAPEPYQNYDASQVFNLTTGQSHSYDSYSYVDGAFCLNALDQMTLS